MPPGSSHRRIADWFRQWRLPLRKWLIARGRVPVADLDDVAQEVFLRLLRYDRAELVESPQAYLFKMATNVAAEWSMRARHRRPHDPKWLADLTADDEPAAELMHARSREQVAQALLALPPRAREVLRLHYAEGLSRTEIADRLAVTPRIVKRDLIQSYARLKVDLPRDLLEDLQSGTGPR